MKILLLGGFLGSGKTSVLLPLAKYLVDHSSYEGTKVAIVENEIGDVSIDGITLRNAGLSVTELFSGCICCTLGLELLNGLFEMEKTQNPEWVIIEATGVACPGNVRESILESLKSVSVVRTAVLCDAERMQLLLKAISSIAPQQIKDADVLLLNKIDLVDEETLAADEQTIRELNAEAPIFRVCARDGIDEAVFAAVIGGN